MTGRVIGPTADRCVADGPPLPSLDLDVERALGTHTTNDHPPTNTRPYRAHTEHRSNHDRPTRTHRSQHHRER